MSQAVFNAESRTLPSETGRLHAGNVMEPLLALLAYVQDCDYEGYDLFDGLNSPILKKSPLYRNAIFRLALIQLCKHSPINLRRLLRVREGFNPKGGALFLMGHLNLYRHTRHDGFREEAANLYRRLAACRIRRPAGSAWGYNFDWQARAFYVPMGTPNLVTTVYAGRALLDYGTAFDIPEALGLAAQAGRFLLDEMILCEDEHRLCFRYIPGKDAEVHNANLLGAAFLAEILHLLPPEEQEEIRQKVLKALRFSVQDIREDGSWPYGTKPFHRWVDNFHTAFNIESMLRIRRCLQADVFGTELDRVTRYYLTCLFTEDGLPRYYNNRTYPVDVHVIAQAIVLLGWLKQPDALPDDRRLACIESKLHELVGAFQDRRGFFYHQKLASGWNRIPYIRWGQAWMFFALSSCLEPRDSLPRR